MKILMHCCCAPCALAPYAKLTAEGQEIVPYFYNPNIHPYLEYKRRRDTFLEYFGGLTTPLITDDYALEDFLRQVAANPTERCGHCYRLRLEQAAKMALEQGCEAFTSSLLISPYQNHELLRQTGEEMAALYGIPFYYEDFRPLFREGQNRARELELYRQPYCGCIYSEKERYCKNKK